MVELLGLLVLFIFAVLIYYLEDQLRSKQCPECARILAARLARCPKCGHVFLDIDSASSPWYKSAFTKRTGSFRGGDSGS